MSKIVISSVCLCLLVLMQCGSNGISLDEAEDIVLEEILLNDTQGIRGYELPTKVDSGQDISNPNRGYAPFRDAWFFFIDYEPYEPWPHSCRYVFVHCDRGDYIEIPEELRPDNFGELVLVWY